MISEEKRALALEKIRMRTILHSDLNNFYASVELLKHPECKDVPVVVCGSVEDRHGIVLAKNQLAKSFGVKTGEVLWQAKKKCKDNLITFTADFPSYQKVSREVRKIYECFTDRIESFGIDECWLDVTKSVKIFGPGEQIAEKIRQAVKEEIGVTVSVGVSYNKVFAKLGSDMKKPDAVTVITADNYRQTVWKLPAEDLLYVGKSTKTKLNMLGIRTIGDIAKTEESVLVNLLGIWGSTLHKFANGLDDSVVDGNKGEDSVKSIGNSLTDYKDNYSFEEVKTLILLLSESVASRLRESGLGKAKTVKLTVTDNALMTYGRQTKLENPTRSGVDIATCAYELFNSLYTWERPVRGIGVTVCDFTFGTEQLSFSFDIDKEDKKEKVDQAVDKIRKKYGNKSVQRARILQDKKWSGADIKDEHVIYPKGFTDNNKE